MGYKDIKLSLRNEQRAYKKCKAEFRQIQQEMNDYIESKESIREKYEHQLKVTRNQEIRELLKKESKPFEERINHLGEVKKKVLEDKKQELSLITKDNYMREYIDDIDMNNKIMSMADNLRVSIKEALGDRLGGVVYSVVDTNTFSLDFDDVAEVEQRIESLSKRVDRICKGKKFNFHKIMNNTWAKWDTKKVEENNINMIVYIVLMLIFSIVVYKYLFSFVLLAYFVMIIINVTSSNTLYDCIIESKILLDNIQSINDSIDKMVEEQLMHDLKATSTEFDEYLDKVDYKIAAEEQALSEALALVEKSYNFDDSLTKANWKTEQAAVEDKIILSESRLRDCKNKMNTLLDSIGDLNNQLKDAIDVVRLDYMPPMFDKENLSFIFQNEFLYDIVDNKPIIFEHPECSCLFIYDSQYEEDIKTLITIFVIQTMNRMKVTSYKNYVLDSKHACIDFSALKCNDYLLELITTEEDIKSCGSNLISIMRDKVEIMSAYQGIKQYNEELLAMGSVSESYNLVYYLNPEFTMLNSQDFSQLARKGYTLGIFVNYFMSSEEFYKGKENSLRLLDTVERVFTYDGGEIMRKSKDFVRENIPLK